MTAIREPIAVSPLVKVFGDQAGPLRSLLDHVLEQIPGPESASALVWHILSEPDSDVRHMTMAALSRRKDPNIIPGLLQGLRTNDPAVVNRAAWTLGQLNAVSSVPALINALLTTRYHVVMDPSAENAMGIPGGSSSGFGSLSPGPVGGLGLSGATVSGGCIPVVGPGVAAYGAVGVPFSYGAGLSLGGGGGGGSGMVASRGPLFRMVPETFQNVEVLATLVKLTGQDFGYDIHSWKRWSIAAFKSEPKPLRRVPQP